MYKKFKPCNFASKPHRAKYAQTSSYEAVWLPYKSSTIRAVVVLPSPHLAKHGIAAAVTQLDVDQLLIGKYYKEVDLGGLVVEMPKFKVSTQGVSLKEVGVCVCCCRCR